MEFYLKTLAPVWARGLDKERANIPRPSGLRGSIRWWYEALVRGLHGYACDPTDPAPQNRCEFNTRSFSETRNLRAELDKICPVCELFGCTGWSSKLAIQGQMEGPDRLHLLMDETKELTKQEICLLNATIRLIVEHGALGARTALKPSEIGSKNLPGYPKNNHLDYGIVSIAESFLFPELSPQSPRHVPGKQNQPDWPDLQYFWFVQGAYLNRQDINAIVDRGDNGQYRSPNEAQVFVGGYIKEGIDALRALNPAIGRAVDARGLQSDSESKKIFSFHGMSVLKQHEIRLFNPRCFGYARDDKEMKWIADQVEICIKKREPGVSLVRRTGEEVLREFGLVL